MTSLPVERLRGVGIAHLIETDGPGGAEQTVVNMATSLQAAGSRNIVVIPANAEGWLAQQLADTGVHVEYFHLDRPISPACARFLTGVMRRHDIALAHSHEFSMAIYGAWAAWRAHIPHVITMHGSRYYAARLQRRVAMRLALEGRGQLVAVSQSLADALRTDLALPGSRVQVVANGVRFQPATTSSIRAELHLSGTDRLVVAVGNLYPVKGHAVLIDALALLHARHPTVHVAIAGRGELADDLRRRATERGLERHVHFLGLRSDVANLLAGADIFALPSLSEGLPLAILEAMFAGRPIVATRVGEVSTALDRGDAGVLVEPGQPDALAAALDRLLGDPAEANSMGERAQRRATAVYDVSHMVAQYAEIYDTLLPGSGTLDPFATSSSLRRTASER